MTIFVVESVREDQSRKLFSLFGAEYRATRYAWLNPLLMAGVGIAVAYIWSPVNVQSGLVVTGIIFGLLMMLAIFCHGLGHMISSRIVQAPVSYVLVTATVNVTHYDDVIEQSSRVHIGRSLGGPVANLLLGAVCGVLYMTASPSPFLLFFSVVCILMGLMTLLPIPTLDGAVIWHNLGDRHA